MLTTRFTTLSTTDTQQNINNKLFEVSTWLNLNKMSLNCNKTKATIFQLQKKIQYPILKIDSEEIEYVKKFNFFGIIINCDIKWECHALNISKKLSSIME